VTQPVVRQPIAPRLEAIIVLVIASIALLATSYGTPSITTSFEGETSFDGPGDRTVPFVVRLNEAAWRSAMVGSQSTGEPVADLEVYEPRTGAVTLAGAGALSLDGCAGSGDCDVPGQLTVGWTGDGPATVIWTVQPWIYFNDGSIPDGASVGVVGPTPNRLPALALIGAALGILGAILAWVLRRRLGPGARAAADRGTVVAAAAVAALAGGSLLAGPLADGPGPIVRGSGLAFLGFSIFIVAAGLRRARDGGLLLLATLGAACLVAVPLLIVVLVQLPVYRPILVVAGVAILVGVLGLGLPVAAALEGSSSAGRALTRPQRLVVLAQAGATAAFAISGSVALGSIDPASLGDSQAPVGVAAVAFLLAVLSAAGLRQWLHGRTRLVTVTWIVVGLVTLLGLVGYVLLGEVLLPAWESPLAVAIARLLTPQTAVALGVVTVAIAVVRARRSAPAVSGGGT